MWKTDKIAASGGRLLFGALAFAKGNGKIFNEIVCFPGFERHIKNNSRKGGKMDYCKRVSAGVLFHLAIGFISFLLLAVAGCGSKKKPTAASPAPAYQPGNPNDSNYVFVKELTDEGLVPGTMEVIRDGLDNLNGFSPGGFVSFSRPVVSRFLRAPSLGALMRPTAPETTIIGYENGWHFFIYDTSFTYYYGTSATIRLADSVQFRNPSGPQEFPDSTTNKLQVIHWLDLFLREEAATLDAKLYSNQFFQLAESGYTVNGKETDNVKYDDDSNHIAIQLSQTVTNLVLTVVEDTLYGYLTLCPVSGSIRFAGSYSASGPDIGEILEFDNLPNGSFSINFDITVTFSGTGQVQVVVLDTGRRLRWEYALTDICTPPPF